MEELRVGKGRGDKVGENREGLKVGKRGDGLRVGEGEELGLEGREQGKG
jgi:hypothetical protein